MKASIAALLLCALLALAGCGEDSSDSTEGADTTAAAEASADTGGKPEVTVPDGDAPTALVENDLVEGDGPEAQKGDNVTVQYVGVGFDSGEEFDASWGREPFTFQLGAGQVIPGWEEGVEGMKAGGRRELLVPPDMAYGEAGFPPSIGPNEALVFVVDLLEIG